MSLLFPWRKDLALNHSFAGDILAGAILTIMLIPQSLAYAVLGRIRGTEHFRNIHRHEVETLPDTRFVRVDANLFFGNWSRVREAIDQAL